VSRICAFVILLALSVLDVQQSRAITLDKGAEIDSLLTRSYRYELFNGAALVAEGGGIILEKGYGFADLEWGIPNTADTKFRLGSVTKQFTAMLVLQLVEAGTVDLDGTISAYLPYYREDTGHRVTIHHLLCHQTGIPNFTSDQTYPVFSKLPTPVETLIQERCSGDLAFEPGSRYAYSNSNYVILGGIIEAVTGKSYEDVLQERILNPLQMGNSGYDRNEPIIPNRSVGYQPTLEGYQNARYIDMSIPHGAGALYSTVHDMFRWDRALYTDTLLSAEYRGKLFTPNLQAYAYGWRVATRPVGDTGDSVTVVDHTGGINGFQSIIVRIPEHGHLIVLLSNTVGAKLGGLSRAVLSILYDQPYEMPKRSLARVLHRVIGEDGVDAAVESYYDLKSAHAHEYDFAEFELNILGYGLLERGMIDEAIGIFKLNVEAYPGAFNTYDSLGEAYIVKGDTDLAIANLRKSLELNPENTHAEELIRQMTSE
jgi:CubicO group peptidase (beta-lactamase class C family)